MIGGLNHTVPIGVATDMFGYGLSTQPILIMNVECSGNENNISECSHSEISNVGVCLHADDAGVICEGGFIQPEKVCGLTIFLHRSSSR